MGTRKTRLGEVVLTCTHNLCFEQKLEKSQHFSAENFQFFKKNSIFKAKKMSVYYMGKFSQCTCIVFTTHIFSKMFKASFKSQARS